MHPATKLLFNYTKGAQSLLSVISSFSLPNTGKPHTADAAQRKAGKQFRQPRRHAAAKACCQQQEHPGQLPAQAQTKGCKRRCVQGAEIREVGPGRGYAVLLTEALGEQKVCRLELFSIKRINTFQ